MAKSRSDRKFNEPSIVIGVRVPKSKKEFCKLQFQKIVDKFLAETGDKIFDFEIRFENERLQVGGTYNENSKEIEVLNVQDHNENSIFYSKEKLKEIELIIFKELFA